VALDLSLISVKMNSSKEKPKERTIRGKIFPAQWDENGQVNGIVIDTTDQDEYHIEGNDRGKELLKFIRRDVELTGTIREGETGQFVFTVQGYNLIDDLNAND
jgi:hypothetical protein